MFVARESNPRQPGLEPGALPAELTTINTAFVRPHVRYTPQPTPHVRAKRAAGPAMLISLIVKETPVGVEPTSTALQAAASPSGSDVISNHVML